MKKIYDEFDMISDTHRNRLATGVRTLKYEKPAKRAGLDLLF